MWPPPRVIPLADVKFLTDRGLPLRSLFEGVPRYPLVRQTLSARGGERVPNCGTPKWMLARLVDMLSLPSVSAFACGSTPCGSHYMYDYQPVCGSTHCGWGFYAKYVANSMEAAYCDGYLHTGGFDCGSCVCKEDGCNSCPE
jgi:hypothetical protein